MQPADLIRQALKLSLLPYAALAQDARPGIMILTYHQVGGGDARQLDLPVALFEWQMRYLARHRRVVPLDEIIPIAREGSALREDLAVITFDDGYEDVYRYAFPILVRYGLPATVFLSTQFVNEETPFKFSRRERRPRGRPLRWEQIREMARSGLITVGAHTHSHADLTKLQPDQVAYELGEANRLIAEHVGQMPGHFAYPWGRASAATREVVARTYRTAAAGRPRKNLYGEIDLVGLRRVPIQRSDGRFFFRLKLAAWPIPAPSTMVPQ